MNSTAIILLLLSCLLLCVQGEPDHGSRKCKCLNGYVGRVNQKLIMSEPRVYQPSSFCPELEITIVLGTKEKCVNPESRFGQHVLSRQERKRAARSTTASQSNTESSTSL
ncbi:C-X-C motif chemokine 11-like [Solea senegalensis]|uniref:C-X-C motif chemokine 11-like n=1 Tax=Solea senegalensis TaxID=28829 RepID=A0AAV6QDD8_SOLSE|nr:C-X-C motif chemokine 11-like [Solea senegalensis]KAG7489303.1 C-X-C motif chemokine 11-like [Solea senegalensis]KAG7489304.1 C-X-C motif chemokine 11-like [Solea senegalensis]